ncbi:hypothetical protein BDZ97DRAFT_741420 [Flammula alnicola]|nr:hypothetical protein BDZ97DRAFT_741420 [Flammula alnicola]
MASSSPIHPRTNITSLPPELLSIIFQFVHEISTAPKDGVHDTIPDWMLLNGAGYPDQIASIKADVNPQPIQGFRSPTLFPYALAAVCPLWSEVLSFHPHFWTMVILFIDSHFTPLIDAALLLGRSRDLPISVIITSRKQLRPKSHPDLHEKSHIGAFLSLLAPHLHRLRSFHVDAHLSSSLPDLDWKFIWKAEKLCSMALICDRQDIRDEDEEDYFFESVPKFSAILSHLVVDGRNFRKTFEGPRCWVDTLESVTIAHYSSQVDDTFSIAKFALVLENLLHLTYLKLDDVYFHPDSETPETSADLCIDYLHLQSLDTEFLEELLRICSCPNLNGLRITHCSIPPAFRFPDEYIPSLILEDIDSTVDLMEAIGLWYGDRLYLDGCESFSDTFLDKLSTNVPVTNPSNGTESLHLQLPKLSALLLRRLPKFSIQALKNMVEKRNESLDYTYPAWRSMDPFGPEIYTLIVVQCPVEKPSAEDMEWFHSRVAEFEWIE